MDKRTANWIAIGILLMPAAFIAGVEARRYYHHEPCAIRAVSTTAPIRNGLMPHADQVLCVKP